MAMADLRKTHVQVYSGTLYASEIEGPLDDLIDTLVNIRDELANDGLINPTLKDDTGDNQASFAIRSWRPLTAAEIEKRRADARRKAASAAKRLETKKADEIAAARRTLAKYGEAEVAPS